ncbi:MAG: tyrosine--tRNA ligase [Candidatus Nomurabacteria bacterium]|nr:MAG: tyrosine--tRNA ligase [Candidatus Nomurabacteria bacterium]
MNLSEELAWRGFINQTTYTDIKELDSESISFYWGVDPSASSMTIGNLAAAMLVRHFVDHGHKAFLLVGGATGMIGDPDGKKDERNLKTLDEIASNKVAISVQYERIFAGKPFEIVDNYDWFKDINYLNFLRDVGKHVPLSSMLGRDFVQARLGESGSGISYAEFSYGLIQGYDFLHLYREKGVTLQVCGADQWGNSITGVDLIRRIEGGNANVLSSPLIVNKTTGVKFGKSEDGAVWLDPTLTSVYKFYQFWLNVDDEGALDYAKIYTLLGKEQIDELAAKQQANPGARDIQKSLAYEVTKLVHGEGAAESAKRVTGVLFGGTEFSSLSQEDINLLANEIPSASTGASVVDLLTDNSLAASKGEARRLILGGAVSINGEKILDDKIVSEPTLVKRGKNSFLLVR